MQRTYRTLKDRLSSTFPRDRLIDSELLTHAYATDASFYRLIPRLVVKAEDEREIKALLRQASELRIPLTFRAAGTSLSGQAVSDSVLAVLGHSWKGWKINDNGATISLEPGVVGGFANALLAQYGRKIGPDPASINAAMIGGIVANNASGMCCGTAQNSYKTLQSMRIIFSDGTSLDTADSLSKEQFRASRPEMLSAITALADRVKSNSALRERITKKYRIKNTTGYSLNALVDFEDPFDIIQHLMVGSEGTLGFMAEVTLRTVPELPHKATSLLIFPSIETSCSAVEVLSASAPVDAVELMDRASLHSVEMKEGMPEYLKDLDNHAAALLIETRAEDNASLQRNIAHVTESLSRHQTLFPVSFTENPAEFGKLWGIRKGLFPAVGAMRPTGTTVIIEDVAFPVPSLARGTLDLQKLFRRHHYDEAIIFGHARDGNLHFVFNQDFNIPSEVERYKRFMDELTVMVVKDFEGSLKAEHGTGRNIAPFVELEWGSDAYQLMKEIKNIFDPGNILNPGVILNADREAHVRNLKPLPPADPLVDKCIECGFCEVYCPSKDITLTPRQRIAVFREMRRLEASKESPHLLRILEKTFQYQGDATCATDGLCALACPVHINTGELVKELRTRRHGALANLVAGFLAKNMHLATASGRAILKALHVCRNIFGAPLMRSVASFVHKLSFRRLPLWNEELPKAAERLTARITIEPGRPNIVYFPTCINRTFGTRPDSRQSSLISVAQKLLLTAGYNAIVPQNVDRLCCGMAFASKGFRDQGMMKSRELEQALLQASNGGDNPVLVDMSPCLLRMKETFGPSLKLYDQIDFAEKFLMGRLRTRRMDDPVAIHATCSTTKMGMEGKLAEVAGRLSSSIVIPKGVGCCGWAGDRGFTVPELNASALSNLRREIPGDCRTGYSTSTTCEIGLSLHGGLPYMSLFHLIDRCLEPENDRN